MATFPTWDPEIEYAPEDTVFYNNFYYSSLTLNLDNPPASNPFWLLLGASIWSADIGYAAGIVVTDGTSFYASLANNIGNAPSTSPVYCEVVGPAELKGTVGFGDTLLKMYGPPS
jgi:hypothetical protein